MLSNPYQKYQQNQVETASPAKLLLMLYNGALRFVKAAREGIREKDMEKANHNIGKAQDIVVELMTSLDMEQGEISRNLYSLYDFVNTRLLEANIKKDENILSEAENILQELRDTWQEASLKDIKEEES